jgi:DUSP domain.
MKVYANPGKIINKNLLKSDIIFDLNNLNSDIELKENLLEHHDYEAVCSKIFEVLSRWYGCDFEIVRLLRPDPFRNHKLYLDLYPSKLRKDFFNSLDKDKSKMRLSDPKRMSSNYTGLTYGISTNTSSNGDNNKIIKDIITSNLANPFKKKTK